MTAAVFEVLVTSSVMTAAIFGLRKLTMGRISMRLRYGLWLLVAVRLLVPLSVGTSPISVMNLFSGIRQERALQSSTAQETDRQENGARPGEVSQAVQTEENGAESTDGLLHPAQDAGEQNQNTAPAIDGAQGGTAAPDTGAFCGRTGGWMPVVVAVWFSGVLAVGGSLFFLRARFVRYLQRNRRKISGNGIPAAIGEKLAKRGMRVYRVKGLPSPCLVGRCIYIGERTSEDGQGLTHVLAHEYCHRVHGDGFWAFLRCALAALYWFDPLVWAAAFAARQDSDLACDEAAVELLGEEERFDYARTLLALLQESSGKAECPGMPLMFSGGESSVRERIVSLAEKRKADAVVLVPVISMGFLLCGCAFTGSADQEVAGADRRNGDGRKQWGWTGKRKCLRRAEQTNGYRGKQRGICPYSGGVR